MKGLGNCPQKSMSDIVRTFGCRVASHNTLPNSLQLTTINFLPKML